MPAALKAFLAVVLVAALLFGNVYQALETSPVRPRPLSNASCVPLGMRMALVLGDLHMVVLGDDDIVSKSLFHRHHWRITGLEELATLARSRLPDRGVFLDLGAHVGYLSLLFAQQGFRVVAVEPMARNSALALRSAALVPRKGFGRESVPQPALAGPGADRARGAGGRLGAQSFLRAAQLQRRAQRRQWPLAGRRMHRF